MYSQWDNPTRHIIPPDHRPQHLPQRPHMPHPSSTSSSLLRDDSPYGPAHHRPPPSFQPTYPSIANLSGIVLFGQPQSGPSGIITDDRAWKGGIGLGYPTLLAEPQGNYILRGGSPEKAWEGYEPNPPVPPPPAQNRKPSGRKREITVQNPSQALRHAHGSKHSSHSSQISRSWTLDSGARSTLTPFEATHMGRPLTRSPYPRNRSPLKDDGQEQQKDGDKVYRGPPKAKLGGPNGKTYEELRAGDSRIVSAPARTPPLRGKKILDDDEEVMEEKRKQAKKRSVTVAVKLPPSHYSPPESPPPAIPADPVVSENEAKTEAPFSRRETFPWPEHRVETSPTAIPLPITPLPPIIPLEPEASPKETTGPVLAANGKEVVVAVPKSDGWERLSSRQTTSSESSHTAQWASQILDRSSAAPSQDISPIPPSNAIFHPQHTASNSIAAQIGHYESASSRAGPLRPFAPPFKPDADTSRRVTNPEAVSIGQQKRSGSSKWRSVSETGSNASPKRLRPNAPPFQPPSSGSHSRTSTGSPTKPRLNPTAPTFSPNSNSIGNSGSRASSASWTLVVDPKPGPAMVFGQPSGLGQSTGSKGASPSGSTGMKRSISGRLRPVAASFVPTGAFTFRPADTASGWAKEKGGSRQRETTGSTDGYLGGLEMVSTVPPPMFDNVQQSDSAIAGHERAGSPAAMLHDLSDNDQNRSHSRQNVIYSSQVDGIENLIDPRAPSNDLEERNCHSSTRSHSPAFALERRSISSITPQPEFAKAAARITSNAHLPTESFGLPSPRFPEPAESLSNVGNAGFTDVFTASSDAPPSRDDFVGSELHTPIEATTPILRASTAEAYETVDGSPLIPRRHLETPATPKKAINVEAFIDPLVSPTPARNHRSRSSMLEEHYETASEANTDADDLLASRNGVDPAAIGQPEIKVDGATDDSRFRNWIFLASPQRRPSFARRYTFPVPIQDQADITGVASVIENASQNSTKLGPAVPSRQLFALELGVIPPPLSTRTSVEFPLRPDKRTLTIANALPGEVAPSRVSTPERTAKPLGNGTVITQEDTYEGRLKGLETLLWKVIERLDDQPVANMDGAVDRLGNYLSEMIVELRQSFNARMSLRETEAPTVTDVERAMAEQCALLQDLAAQIRSAPTSPTDHLEESIASILNGQTTLSRHVSNISDLLLRKQDDLVPAIQALQDAKADLELRKSSEEKKDQLISTLRTQTEELRVSLGVAEADRTTLRAQVDDLRKRDQQWDREKAVLVARSAAAEKMSEEVRGKTDKQEATRMALLAERDGMAQALRESFERLKETDTQLRNVQRELEMVESARLNAETNGASRAQLEQITAGNKAFQESLIAEISRLSKDVSVPAQSRQGEVDGLREDKRILQNEVTELRKKTYDAASKIADADLRLATAANAASCMEYDLRRTVDGAIAKQVSAEKKLADIEAAMEKLRLEKLNMSTIATERSGTMRIMEIRHQALIQENNFWREFALSYDQREHRKYTRSQPFRPASPVLQTLGLAQNPAERTNPSLKTPTNPEYTSTGGGDLEGTPDLCMSVSTSAEGVRRVPREEEGEGHWWAETE